VRDSHILPLVKGQNQRENSLFEFPETKGDLGKPGGTKQTVHFQYYMKLFYMTASFKDSTFTFWLKSSLPFR
jgi:hypothetical protein